MNLNKNETALKTEYILIISFAFLYMVLFITAWY